MEENQNNVEVKGTQKKFDLSTINWKKYLPWAGIALAVIIVAIILIVVFSGGPEKAVKEFVGGMNSKNASKVVDSMDFVGAKAWKNSYKIKNFDEDDYDTFIDKYKDVDKDDARDDKKNRKEKLQEEFDEMKDKYKSYKINVDKIKSTKKLGKDLYAIKAKISIEAEPKDKDDDEIDGASIMTFIVYKNKVIYTTL